MRFSTVNVPTIFPYDFHTDVVFPLACGTVRTRRIVRATHTICVLQLRRCCGPQPARGCQQVGLGSSEVVHGFPAARGHGCPSPQVPGSPAHTGAYTRTRAHTRTHTHTSKSRDTVFLSISYWDVAVSAAVFSVPKPVSRTEQTPSTEA